MKTLYQVVKKKVEKNGEKSLSSGLPSCFRNCCLKQSPDLSLVESSHETADIAVVIFITLVCFALTKGIDKSISVDRQ